MARVLRLPDHGRLLVCTDLQGCLRDFERIVQLFEQALLDFQGDAHLLFTGDLIHGPHIDPEDWPDFLGEYYRDASGDLMMAYAGLTAKYSGRVHALLGNHEHGHIGGPHTAKFAADEVALLEQILGPSATARMRSIIQTFALAGRPLRQPARGPRHADRRQDPVGALGDRGRGPAVPALDERQCGDLRPRRDPGGVRDHRRHPDGGVDQLRRVRHQQGLHQPRSGREVPHRR
ncbi:MAG: hypothetical protein E6J90_29770 [Deltaproteobacteria bacterium]|nr:MAG: hypothetical protein E6J90_29770 [Deltaproteobacteria bacterium]